MHLPPRMPGADAVTQHLVTDAGGARALQVLPTFQSAHVCWPVSGIDEPDSARMSSRRSNSGKVYEQQS
jgi:hypothetical protein